VVVLSLREDPNGAALDGGLARRRCTCARLCNCTLSVCCWVWAVLKPQTNTLEAGHRLRQTYIQLAEHAGGVERRRGRTPSANRRWIFGALSYAAEQLPET
jgi:hypothetical protein